MLSPFISKNFNVGYRVLRNVSAPRDNLLITEIDFGYCFYFNRFRLKKKIALILCAEWNYQLNPTDVLPSQLKPLLKEGKRRKRSFNVLSKLAESSIDMDCYVKPTIVRLTFYSELISFENDILNIRSLTSLKSLFVVV